MNLLKWLLFLLLVWTEFQLIGSKRGGGGGRGGGSRGGSRGGSTGSRGGSTGSRGGNTGNRGGSKGTSGSKSRGGTKNTYKQGKNSFSKGKGVGSLLRSNKVKAGLAGAAAAYITYKAGKAIIGAASRSMMYGGRPYYWGPSYYQQRSGYQMCSYHVENNDGVFGNFLFQDNSQVRQITYGCRTGQYCCGMECCNYRSGGRGSGIGWGLGLLIFFGILLCCCCGVFFILYKFFRSSLDCIFPSNTQDDQPKFDDVPMAPAPNYAPPPSYPSQPQAYSQPAYPSQYPAQPPTYPSQPPSYPAY